MAALHESKVSLSFFGDDLDPVELTTLLGTEPSFAIGKGAKRTPAIGIERIAKTGSWRLEAEPAIPGDLSGQVNTILAKLTDDLAVWRQLTERFHARLFCGLFMEEANEGLRLDPAMLVAVGERGLFLDFDIYGPTIKPHLDEARASQRRS